jgi:hypothetical protein
MGSFGYCHEGLLMAQNNYILNLGAVVVQDSSPCPLVWAVQSGNVDMVLLFY